MALVEQNQDPLASAREVLGQEYRPASIFEERGLTGQGIYGAVRVTDAADPNKVYLIGPGGRPVESPEEFQSVFGTLEQKGVVTEVTSAQAQKLGITGPREGVGLIGPQVKEGETRVNPDTGETEVYKDGAWIRQTPLIETSEAFRELEKELKPEGERPEPPKLLETFQEQRETLGISELEEQVTDVRSRIRELDTAYLRGREELRQAPSGAISLRLLEGRQRELSAQYQLNRQTLVNEQQAIVDTLNARVNTLNTVMNLTNQDYQNASAAYQNAFTQNIQLFNAATGLVEAEKTEDQRRRDAARADLQIMYDTITEGNLRYEDLDPEMKTHISLLETRAGWPIGMMGKIRLQGDGRKMLTSTTFVNNKNQQVVSVIFQNKDGGFETQEFVVGTARVSTGGGGRTGTEAERNRAEYGWVFEDAQQEFVALRDADAQLLGARGEEDVTGYVDLAVYRSYLAELPFDLQEDFNTRYGGFLRERDRELLGILEEEE